MIWRLINGETYIWNDVFWKETRVAHEQVLSLPGHDCFFWRLFKMLIFGNSGNLVNLILGIIFFFMVFTVWFCFRSGLPGRGLAWGLCQGDSIGYLVKIDLYTIVPSYWPFAPCPTSGSSNLTGLNSVWTGRDFPGQTLHRTAHARPSKRSQRLSS